MDAERAQAPSWDKFALLRGALLLPATMWACCTFPFVGEFFTGHCHNPITIMQRGKGTLRGVLDPAAVVTIWDGEGRMVMREGRGHFTQTACLKARRVLLSVAVLTVLLRRGYAAVAPSQDAHRLSGVWGS